MAGIKIIYTNCANISEINNFNNISVEKFRNVTLYIIICRYKYNALTNNI